MSMFEGLSGLQDAPKDDGWRPPLLGYGYVLAFDQSFAATGWVSLLNDPAGLRILDAGTIATDETEWQGLEQDFRRTMQLADLVRPVAREHLRPESILAHEMPAIGGKFITNSSRFSALAIWFVGAELGHTPVQVNRQSWAKAVANMAKEKSKAKIHKKMAEWAGDAPGWEMLTNQARRDAFGVGVKVLANKAPALH